MEFYRLVLDEAHAIKNSHSRRTKACTLLAAKYRWALTGTPIHNSLKEIIPYWTFLRVLNSPSLVKFKAKNEEEIALKEQELAAVLEKIMLKRYSRSINTEFLAHALFELPRPHVLDPIWVNFSREEELIHRMVEGKLRKRVAKAFMDTTNPGTLKAQSKSWLLYVLRLRQAACHPFLLETLMKTLFEVEDIRRLIQQLSRIQTNTAFINQIGRWSEFDMIRHLERVNDLKEHDQEEVRDLCRRCGSIPEDPFQPECGHVFCRDCIESYIAEEGEGAKKRHRCRNCSRLVANIRASLPAITGGSSVGKGGPRRGPLSMKHRERGDDLNRIQPVANNKSMFLAESDRDPSLPLTPGAKTIVLKNIIVEWRRLHAEDMVIVFTSFVVVGRIIGRMLQDEGINFLYYFGSMSQAEKHQAVKDFANEDIQILGASIQCGGQALNLTCANRVLIMDLCFSTRSFRAIKEHDSSRLTPSPEEIAALFGCVVRDQPGKVIDIVPDYRDDDDDDDHDADNDEEEGEWGSNGEGGRIVGDLRDEDSE
ncbi:hypothetical protein VTK56DRAFT_7539 [Thermocarpiscus australiensis]